MTISIGSRLVYRARLDVHWVGRWVLRAWFADAPPTGKVTVQWGNAQLVGSVVPEKSGLVSGEGVVTIVGGIGWQNEPPALWLVDVSASPAKVAQQLAQAIGETLSADASAIRPGRSAFARANQSAARTLESLLAPNALWWIDFAGVAHAALDRPAPAFDPARVLEFDAEARTVKLDIEEPGDIVGATIAASGERIPFASRMYELSLIANEKGTHAIARIEAPTRTMPYLASLIADAAADATPEPHATFRGATVQSQDASRRVSLRLDSRDKELDDPLPVPAWCGVPGVSAEVFSGTRSFLAFDRADPTAPFAALWSPFGEAGHVPKKVYHEANEEIRFLGTSAGVGRFGTTTEALAKADPTQRLFDAVKAFATAAKASGTDPTLVAAATALEVALSPPFIYDFPTTKLESQ